MSAVRPVGPALAAWPSGQVPDRAGPGAFLGGLVQLAARRAVDGVGLGRGLAVVDRPALGGHLQDAGIVEAGRAGVERAGLVGWVEVEGLAAAGHAGGGERFAANDALL